MPGRTRPNGVGSQDLVLWAEGTIPAVTILPYDVAVARVFGQIRADLEAAGTRLDDADLQIAATALHHGLEIVTGNVRHFSRIEGLSVHRVLADAR